MKIGIINWGFLTFSRNLCRYIGWSLNLCSPTERWQHQLQFNNSVLDATSRHIHFICTMQRTSRESSTIGVWVWDSYDRARQQQCIFRNVFCPVFYSVCVVILSVTCGNLSVWKFQWDSFPKWMHIFLKNSCNLTF